MKLTGCQNFLQLSIVAKLQQIRCLNFLELNHLGILKREKKKEEREGGGGGDPLRS